jgi:outer membrane receptor protein involved in Fe transport
MLSLPRHAGSRASTAAAALRRAALCALLSAAVADAAEALRTYRLPPGELPALLNALAGQSGIQIIYDARLLAGRRSPGLAGRHSVDSALAALLRGSGLRAVAVNADTYVVKPAPQAAAPDAPPVAVVAPVEPATELSRVVVSDAGFRRIAAAAATPVTEITREQIDSSGYATLFDLLKAQPGMQVANQPEAMASSSDANFRTGAAGAAAVALRRLGSKSTLFLVDGRRIAGYGLAQDATGTVPDLNAIPLAMVERIEILRDGASAIHGSDAIAGVVNVILRHDFAGAEASAYAGASDRDDAAAQQTSLLWGARTPGGVGLLLHLDYLHSDPLLGSQRDWYSLDQRRQGLLDLRSPYAFPGNYVYVEPGGLRYVAVPGCAPSSLSADGACLLDNAKYTTLQNGRQGRSLLGRLDAPLGESTRLHLDVRATDLLQRQQAAPSAAGLLLEQVQSPDEPQPTYVFYAFGDIGPVRETTRSKLLSVDAGVDGRLGAWSWGADAGLQRNRVHDTIDGLIRADLLGIEIDGERYTFGETPPSERLRAALAPRVQRHGLTVLDDLSLEAAGPLFDLPAGAAALTAGIEARREGIEQQPGEVLRSGVLLNQPPELPFSHRRVASAGWFKLSLPLTGRLDADLAWRVEKAGAFGPHAAPTLALRWNASDSLVLRASASAGYRVPTLSELHQPRSGGTQEIVWLPDASGPCEAEEAAAPGQHACLLRITTGGNPALRPETSRTVAWGAVWAPSADFSLSADVYRSVRRNEIGAVLPAHALAHPERFPHFAERNAQGELTALNTTLFNIADTTTRGFDVEARWDVDAARAGRFRLSAGFNYLDALGHRSSPDARIARMAGYAGTPRLTAVSTLRWTLGDWIGGANLRYVGSYSLEPYAQSGLSCAPYKAAQGKCAVPPFTLLNLNLTYTGIPRWAFTLSVNNALDHAPRYYDESAGGYNAAFDDAVGRYYAFRATWRF